MSAVDPADPRAALMDVTGDYTDMRDLYNTAKSALLHGVVAPAGAAHLADGVSKDEALALASDLIKAIEVRGGVDVFTAPPDDLADTTTNQRKEGNTDA